MLVLGITGGVGSGKSRVLEYICDNYNVDLIYADNLAKSMLEEDEELICEIKSKFKNDKIFKDNNELDRNRFADVVFNDKNKLEVLNSICHPAVKKRIIKIIDENTGKDNDGLIIEAALLLEEEYDKLFDCVFIYSSEAVRRERLKRTRNYSDDKITAIMKNQMPEEIFRKRCKYTIDNNGDISDTERSVDEILKGRYGLEKKHG